MKLLSDQVTEREIAIILSELNAVIQAGVIGDVVELGCYVGTTSVCVQKALHASGRKLHVYDSFSGLPEKSREDTSPAGMHFKKGELRARKDVLIQNFKKLNLPLPIIHKCWFSDLTQVDMPVAIAFAFLDGDYYQSILDSLKAIWPHLSVGARIVIDDYANEQLPGVERALATWAQHHTYKLRVEAGLAILEPNG